MFALFESKIISEDFQFSVLCLQCFLSVLYRSSWDSSTSFAQKQKYKTKTAGEDRQKQVGLWWFSTKSRSQTKHLSEITTIISIKELLIVVVTKNLH